jgi:ketosteroid isomerase-like protein
MIDVTGVTSMPSAFALILAAGLAFGLAAAGPAPPQAAPDRGEAASLTLPAPLERVLRDYESAWRDGDGPRLAALFTEDGLAMQNGSETARGRDEIARRITRPGGALQLTAYAYATEGGVGYIVGGYRYPESKGPGGRFVLALRMEPGGRWLIAADLDNAPPRR